MNEGVRQTITARVYDVALRTPLDRAQQLSEAIANAVFLKREDLQPVHSFKIRGAYNKMAQLTEAERKAGVIAASAGNHAQGVALAAQKLGIIATIVMPKTTPDIKRLAVESYGAQVILHGDNYSEAADHSKVVAKQTKATYVHPFDDDQVIAGQGTVGAEILDQCPDVDYIFVPVGGGGLIAGVAQYVKMLKPGVRVIGVEPEDSACMTKSLAAGKLLTLDTVGIFADGVAVKQPGERTFELAQTFVDDMVTVTTDEICAAMKDIFQDTRSIVEPSGALGVSGLKKYAKEHSLYNQELVAINSGANMNFERLRFIAERTMTGNHKEALYAVHMPEKPGALHTFCAQALGGHAITEFKYRKHSQQRAVVLVGIGVSDDQDKQEFEATLAANAYKFEDLTSNELAKEHIRYMIGSGSKKLHSSERIVSFLFPERPGALGGFLDTLHDTWNISLFHYRSVGGDIGRVLMGFEVPTSDDGSFMSFLAKTGLEYSDETSNTAFELFM